MVTLTKRIQKELLLIIIFFAVFSSSSYNVFGEKVIDGTYEFIVVGAGTAGCVVASRLSEHYSVLLLESGGDPDPELLIPANTQRFASNPNYVKMYITKPQSNAGLSNNGSFFYLVGKTMGGSSAVNGQIFNRGHPFDYNNWANTTKDPSWGYKQLMKYFKKLENYAGEYPSNIHHGKGGPITISRPKYAPGLKSWLLAGQELGYDVTDPNGPQKISFAPIEFTQQHGQRVSSYSGYIKPHLDKKANLRIVKNVDVTRILFEGTKAKGVKYMSKDGEENVVLFTKEVILSAGVIGSPAILMKSGIGPEDVLKAAGIEPIKLLPVGYNLHDHVFLQVYIDVKTDMTELFIPERDLNSETLKMYNETGDGPFSSVNGVHSQAFILSSIRSREPLPNSEWPDISLHVIQTPGTINLDGWAKPKLKDNQDEYVSITVLVILTRPKSRGRLTLNTEDFNQDPVLDFKYLSHSDDLDAMVDAAKRVTNLYEETKIYSSERARYSKVPLKYCEIFPFKSDDYWKCYVNHMAISGLHGAGSCAMGSKEDSKSVVDSTLKVIGVKNVRVADTSVMPSVTNSNTQAAAYVIGEKVSDLIIKYWKGKNSANENPMDEL